MLRQGHRLAFLFIFLVCFDASHVRSQEQRFFSIATGGVSGTYYPVGGLVANAISHPPGARPCDRGGSCGVPGLVAVANASDGSVANILNMAQGIVNSGFAQSDVAYDAYRGEGAFDGEAVENLRLIASLYLEHAQVVAKDVPNMQALAGRKISIDSDGSGTQRLAKVILEGHGLLDGKVETVAVRPGAALGKMSEGELDGLVIVAGLPTSLVSEIIHNLGAALVPLAPDVIDALAASHPFLSKSEIPAGSYERQDEPIPTLGVVAQWLTTAGEDDQLIYEITKALWHPTSRLLLENGHHQARSITLDSALDGAGLPLHPGAERYYREVGLIAD